MGVDIHGKAFNDAYEEDSKLFSKLGADGYLKVPAEERPWKPVQPGCYFQTSWWTWRPIARFMCDQFPEIASHCTYWQSNDGDGLNAAQAKRLGKRLTAMIEDGSMAGLIEMRDARHRALPDKPCRYCEATGTRTDIEERGPFECNACAGSGKVRPGETEYVFDLDNMKRFAEFCLHSGGFEIH